MLDVVDVKYLRMTAEHILIKTIDEFKEFGVVCMEKPSVKFVSKYIIKIDNKYDISLVSAKRIFINHLSKYEGFQEIDNDFTEVNFEIEDEILVSVNVRVLNPTIKVANKK